MKYPYLVLSVLVGLGLLSICAAAIAFAANFSLLPLSKTDPNAWAQFGEYFGGVLSPLLALLNVVLIAYVATVLQGFSESEKKRLERSAERVDMALSLHREWHSQSSMNSRVRAGKLVQAYIHLDMRKMLEVAPEEEWVHLWSVVSFFQRLHYLIRHDKSDPVMTLDLFGEIFTWWWIVSFEAQLMPTDWESVGPVRALHDWVNDQAAKMQRDTSDWLRRGRAALAAATGTLRDPGGVSADRPT